MTKPKIKPLDLEKYKKICAFHEGKYGVPSERLLEVFTDPETGELHETDEFRRWSFAWGIWKRRTTEHMDWAQVKAAQGIDVTHGFADFVDLARYTYSNDNKVSWTKYPRFGDYLVALLGAVEWLVGVLQTYYLYGPEKESST